MFIGGGGDDSFDGRGGNDYLEGGEGSDTYNFSVSWGVDEVSETGAVGTDTIDFSDASVDLVFTIDANATVEAAGGKHPCQNRQHRVAQGRHR